MISAHDFLINLALVLCVAAVTTVIFQKLRQPVVLGYLLAGAIVSPYTPFPLSADEPTIHTLSELGVILLMFSLGLEFRFGTLVRVAPTAGVVAVIQCSFMLWLGYVCGRLFGWTALESLYAGALIAISSTTIIVKAFAEQRVRGRLTEIVFGVLIVEDLIAVLLLAVLTALSTGAGLTVGSLAGTAGKLLAFLALVVGGGMLVVPRLMRLVVRLNRPETTVVVSVGLCFAFALLAQSADYSVALGAFLGGALVAESGEVESIHHLVEPVRDMFAAVFFVAVGMLINPALITAHWGAVIVFTLMVIGGNLVGVGVGVFLTGQGVRTAIQAGMSLAQIGEFSFIIADLGRSLGATRDFLYPVAVAVSAVTTLTTPWLIRASDPVANYVDRRLPKPIQTFAALYGTWLEDLRTRPREATLGAHLRHLVRLLALDGALLAATMIATALWGRSAAAAIGNALHLPGWVGWTAVFAAAGGFGLPLCIGIGRCAAALSQALSVAALPRGAGAVDTALAPRRALAITLDFAVLLTIGAPLVAITQPFLPASSGALALAAAIIVLGIALWRSVTNLQEHARAGAQAIIEVLAGQGGDSTAAEPRPADLEQLSRLLPGLGAPAPVRLGPRSWAVGKTLAQVNLRGLTGATVLAIARPGANVLIPTGREALQADDVLALTGTAEAIAAARQLLIAGSEGAARVE